MSTNSKEVVEGKLEAGLSTDQIISKRRKMYEMDLFFFGKQIEEQKNIRWEADQKQRQLRAEFLKKYSNYQIGNKLEYEFTINFKGQPLKQREIIIITDIQFTKNTDTMQYDILYIGKRTNKDGFTMNKKTSFEKKVWNSFLMKETTTVYYHPENKK